MMKIRMHWFRFKSKKKENRYSVNSKKSQNKPVPSLWSGFIYKGRYCWSVRKSFFGLNRGRKKSKQPILSVIKNIRKLYPQYHDFDLYLDAKINVFFGIYVGVLYSWHITFISQYSCTSLTKPHLASLIHDWSKNEQSKIPCSVYNWLIYNIVGGDNSKTLNLLQTEVVWIPEMADRNILILYMNFSMNWNQSYQKTLLIDSDLVLFETW